MYAESPHHPRGFIATGAQRKSAAREGTEYSVA